MKKSKKEYDAVVREIPCKIIIWLDEFDNPYKAKMQPKNIIQDNRVSGAHVFRDNPEQNHYDNFYKGEKWRDYNKDYTYPLVFNNISGCNLVSGCSLAQISSNI